MEDLRRRLLWSLLHRAAQAAPPSVGSRAVLVSRNRADRLPFVYLTKLCSRARWVSSTLRQARLALPDFDRSFTFDRPSEGPMIQTTSLWEATPRPSSTNPWNITIATLNCDGIGRRPQPRLELGQLLRARSSSRHPGPVTDYVGTVTHGGRAPGTGRGSRGTRRSGSACTQWFLSGVLAPPSHLPAS